MEYFGSKFKPEILGSQATKNWFCDCVCILDHVADVKHTHLTALFCRTPRVSRYQKVKTNVDFTETRDSEWQWHQLGRMQVCTLLQTDNHASTPPLSFFRPDALPAAQVLMLLCVCVVGCSETCWRS